MASPNNIIWVSCEKKMAQENELQMSKLPLTLLLIVDKTGEKLLTKQFTFLD